MAPVADGAVTLPVGSASAQLVRMSEAVVATTAILIEGRMRCPTEVDRWLDETSIAGGLHHQVLPNSCDLGRDER
ncbi:MAG: hypothetical protein L0Y54_11360 [Sporichthyaceae bacterium]|nr:hypothetical protein [Sporichthyaceae bacterium]